MGFLGTFRSVDTASPLLQASIGPVVEAEDLRFIAEVRLQVQSVYDSYQAGRLPLTSEVMTALSQTREQLLAIRVEGSEDRTPADQRNMACVQIGEMLNQGRRDVNSAPVRPAATPPEPPASGPPAAWMPIESSPDAPSVSQTWAPPSFPDWNTQPQARPKMRKRNAIIGLIAAVAILLIAIPFLRGQAHSGDTGSQATPLTTNPTSLLSSAVSNASAEGWTHAVVKIDSDGHSAVYDQYIGPDEGTQNITIDGDHQLDVILVNNIAYFKADAWTASTFMQMPAAIVPRIAGRWVEVPSSDQAFSGISSDVGLASVLSEDIAPSGPLTESAPTTVDGQRVVGVTGGLPTDLDTTGTQTVYISTGPHPLPVAITMTGQDVPNQIDFANWGVTHSISPPPEAIPAATVGL
jgi:hypothetical protein